jgi:hypothetical protein
MQIEDFHTAAWKRLAQRLEVRLQSLREDNDKPSNDELKTALIRGQIKAVKEILALPQESASPVGERGHSLSESPSDWRT